MIRYHIDDRDLIAKLNRDWLGRTITPEQISKAVEDAKEKAAKDSKEKSGNGLYPICGVLRDSSICLDDIDFNDRTVYGPNFIGETMVRFKRDAVGTPLIRIPAPYPRLYRHRRNDDSFCGYFLMASFFDVCPLEEIPLVLFEYDHPHGKIKAKQDRLQEVYTTPEHGPIRPADLVSVYYIQKHIGV